MPEFQIRTVPSPLADSTRVPSSEKVAAVMLPECPSKRRTMFPLALSQRISWLS